MFKFTSRSKALNSDFILVLKKSCGVFGFRGFGAVAAFIVNIYLARSLGVKDFGLFSLAFTVISILAVFSRFGLDTVALRDISRDKNAAMNGCARAILKSAIQLVLPIALGLMGVITIISPWVAASVFSKPHLSPILTAMLPLLLFLSIGYILGEGLKAIHHPVVGILVQTSILPVGFLLALFCSSRFYPITLEAASLTYSIVALLGLVLSTFFWHARTLEKKDAESIGVKQLFQKGFTLLLMSSGGLLLVWSDVIVLGIFENEGAIGAYSAASKLALATSIILVSVNAIVAPKFSQLYASGNSFGLKKLAKQATRIMVLLVLFPTMLFLLSPDFVLGIFGDGFESAVPVLMILTIGQFVNVVCGSVGYMLIMTGNETIMRNIMLFTAITNILLSVMLVSFLGMVGVAIATAFSVGLWNMSALVAVRRQLGFWMVG